MSAKRSKARRENAIQRFFRETIGELRRVTWPTRQEAVRLTVLVMIVMVVMSVFLWSIEIGAEALLTFVIGAR